MENKPTLLIQGKYCSGEQYSLGNNVGGNKNIIWGNRITVTPEQVWQYSFVSKLSFLWVVYFL